jgi:putative ubiquitin-RnfH superfamily antitoxin RatB of RatAB toxin-antitoxin module
MADQSGHSVEVCYARADDVFLVTVVLGTGSTIADAIAASGVISRFPEIDLARNRVGVFGKLRPLDTPVQGGERIEIYRPLQADPMESRRRRARHKAAAEGRKG